MKCSGEGYTLLKRLESRYVSLEILGVDENDSLREQETNQIYLG